MKYKNLFIATTDSVVGIGAVVNKKNKKALYKIKKRKKEKKLILMVSSIEQAKCLTKWNDNAEKLAQKYWPGQLTIIVNDISLRMPGNKQLLNLIKKIGTIYMTSANKSGQPSCDFQKAIKEFPEIKQHYNFGIGSEVATTIVRSEDLEIIRQGNIKVII